MHSTDQKTNIKRRNTSPSPVTKRARLEIQSTVTAENFRKSESYDNPDFLQWLKTNQHLRTIKGGASNICKLLDKARQENPGLNKIFLSFVNNGEMVDPHYYDIAELLLPNDSVIHPPEWKDRTDSETTYVWSFDIPSEDLKNYCEEIEQAISDPYLLAIAAQFRKYLKNLLPLDNQVNTFRWLYVGQTKQNPAFNRWKGYYKKKTSQRTLNFAMITLVKRRVPHRLVVVSSDGSLNMEAVVAALLNIRVDIVGKTANAINRMVSGHSVLINEHLCTDEEHTQALLKYNPDIEMIECIHCNTQIQINPKKPTELYGHACPATGMKRNNGNRSVMVHARLFSKTFWCPSKQSCQGCIVIVPRPTDFLEDLSVGEILLKSKQWKCERQRLILSTFDTKKSKIVCKHCTRNVNQEINTSALIILRHPCSSNNVRGKDGRLLKVLSSLFTVHEWCTDKANCKSCIQIVDR